MAVMDNHAKPTKRERLIETTCHLMEAQGYHATGLNQIIEESGAPKGSLYYYFPGGKEELATEAIERTGNLVAERISRNLANLEGVGRAIKAYIGSIADALESSGFQSGGPLTAVAMESATTNKSLNRACQIAFDRILAAFEAWLVSHGYGATRSAELATFITAAIEGAVILSRTQHSGDPLRQVAKELPHLLENARET
jgi:TetR/AcrR family transcriptional repressor of lmrAB and yxaGH operons